MLLLGYKCFTLKYKALVFFKKTKNKPKTKKKNQKQKKPTNTTSLEGNREVIQCSCSNLVLLLSSPIPKSAAGFHSLVDEPLAGLLPPAGSTPHISVLHPIDLPTLFPLPSRLPVGEKGKLVNMMVFFSFTTPRPGQMT